MDDVVACLLFYTVVILYMTSSTPERFRRSWFWGVTDWYQSIVYSEYSISTHKRYTNYKYIGTKTLCLRVILLNNKIFNKVYVPAFILKSVSQRQEQKYYDCWISQVSLGIYGQSWEWHSLINYAGPRSD